MQGGATLAICIRVLGITILDLSIDTDSASPEPDDDYEASAPNQGQAPSMVAGTTTYPTSDDTTMGFRMPSTDY